MVASGGDSSPPPRPVPIVPAVTGGEVRVSVAPLVKGEPNKVAGYRILGRLGTGGMGVVYLGEADGRRVAVKQIRADLASDDSFRSRFKREVDAAGRLGGRFTAAVLASDVDAARPYLVTEFVDGPNLADAVRRSGPMQREQLLALAAGLAQALAAAHEAGVVHRDVKPTNVLLAAEGPKLIDFGIAYAAEATAITRTGVFTGSPAWMSPEQVDGRTVSASADIFSWGATVVFAGTGRPPFGEGKSDAVMFRILNQVPDLEGLDVSLRALCERALAKDPAARPTATQLAAWAADLTLVGQPGAFASTDDTQAFVTQTWTAPLFTDQGTGRLGPDNAPDQSRGRILAGALAAVAVVLALVFAFIGSRADDHPDATARAATTSTTTSTSTTTTTTTASTTTTTTSSPDAKSLDVTAFIPDFHDEQARLVADRGTDPAAILVASAPRQEEPRPITFTLIEWDQDHYATADQMEIDCYFVEQLLVDEDQAMFLGCTGGASAHFGYAILPNRLKIELLPGGTDEDPDGGWLIGGFDTIPRPGQPDDLTLYGKRCEPSCADSKTDVYDLVWNPTFRWWDLVRCTEEGGASIVYDPPWNGSVSHITYEGCPR